MRGGNGCCSCRQKSCARRTRPNTKSGSRRGAGGAGTGNAALSGRNKRQPKKGYRQSARLGNFKKKSRNMVTGGSGPFIIKGRGGSRLAQKMVPDRRTDLDPLSRYEMRMHPSCYTARAAPISITTALNSLAGDATFKRQLKFAVLPSYHNYVQHVTVSLQLALTLHCMRCVAVTACRARLHSFGRLFRPRFAYLDISSAMSSFSSQNIRNGGARLWE